jgi:hypothetical protein
MFPQAVTIDAVTAANNMVPARIAEDDEQISTATRTETNVINTFIILVSETAADNLENKFIRPDKY